MQETADDILATETTQGMELSCANASSLAATFFREQDDLLSEVMFFLDIRSLLRLCHTSKHASECLRYEHVVSSTRNQSASSHESTIHSRKRTADLNAIVVLNKLVQVFGLGDKTAVLPNRTTKPSPLRLLRLVQGKRCERCHRDLVSPCVWAGTSGRGTMVLPSLSFGEFCCTQCIFDHTRVLKAVRRPTGD